MQQTKPNIKLAHLVIVSSFRNTLSLMEAAEGLLTRSYRKHFKNIMTTFRAQMGQSSDIYIFLTSKLSFLSIFCIILFSASSCLMGNVMHNNRT